MSPILHTHPLISSAADYLEQINTHTTPTLSPTPTPHSHHTSQQYIHAYIFIQLPVATPPYALSLSSSLGESHHQGACIKILFVNCQVTLIKSRARKSRRVVIQNEERKGGREGGREGRSSP